MSAIKKLKKLSFVITFAAALTLIGCFDNDDNCPSCPFSGDTTAPAPNPTLENIWPNADSSAWTYQYTFRTWKQDSFTFYSTEDSVPDIPDMSIIEDLLINNPVGDSVTTTDAIYRLQFDGDITTGSGAEGQNLKETIFLRNNGSTAISHEINPTKTFLARLCIARPDLVKKIAREYKVFASELSSLSSREFLRGEISESAEEILLGPSLLSGGAWEKTSNHIGRYGDLNQLLSWKYLESELDVGHEFTHQLVPDLASDVFLHCKILRSLTVETETGSFDKAIECAYVVDFGIWSNLDIYGHSLGYTRSFNYGEVIYAPTVGPVYCYEREIVSQGDTITSGSGDQILSLIGSSTIR